MPLKCGQSHACAHTHTQTLTCKDCFLCGNVSRKNQLKSGLKINVFSCNLNTRKDGQLWIQKWEIKENAMLTQVWCKDSSATFFRRASCQKKSGVNMREHIFGEVRKDRMGRRGIWKWFSMVACSSTLIFNQP